MPLKKSEDLPIRTPDDIVRVRQLVRSWAVGAGFRLVEQTKIVTAASEIARNTVDYGGGGSVRLELLEENGRQGLRLVFTDEGPGIPDLDLAMTDGWTTGNGLGLGLSGTKRLAHQFDLWSEVGKGTRVTATWWR